MDQSPTLTRSQWLEALRDYVDFFDRTGTFETSREQNHHFSARHIGFRLAMNRYEPHSTEDITTDDIAGANKMAPIGIDIIRAGTEDLARRGWLVKVGNGRYRMVIPPPTPPAGWKPLTHALYSPQPVATPPGRRCALYRWRDEQGTLLYIGITHDVARRDAGHAAKSPWWCFAQRQSAEWFPNRADAETAEREAIRNEAPLFNRQHNDTPAARQRIGEYLGAHKRMDLFYDAMTAP
jgi:predicted GIY-YIG superfamily endonuclease